VHILRLANWALDVGTDDEAEQLDVDDVPSRTTGTPLVDISSSL
jgi:hypothetical protein